jgi:hypothetical protein
VKTEHKLETEAFPARELRKGNKKILCQDGNKLVYVCCRQESVVHLKCTNMFHCSRNVENIKPTGRPRICRALECDLQLNNKRNPSRAAFPFLGEGNFSLICCLTQQCVKYLSVLASE